jgi:histidinol-phosphate aminotransferase
MLTTFFNNSLIQASSRLATSQISTGIRLDKNEQSTDIQDSYKEVVLQHLMQTDWHRYPSNDYSDIEAKVANYCGMKAEQIALSAGSATLITTLLNYFAICRKHIVITQPTYSLFDYHCKTYNIPYEPWMLNEQLEYDLDTLPAIDQDSVVIITSPNNPVGNTIEKDQLIYLLEMYPDTLFMLDGVYAEFCSIDFTSLVNEYSNLIILRSFSKAFPAAGLRLGYLVSNASITALVRKLLLQFSLNPFTLAFAREVLFQPEFQASSTKQVQEIIAEREFLFSYLQDTYTEDQMKVYPSQGNFLLIRIEDDQLFKQTIDAFAQENIKVLNTSSFALLSNTFRVSVGNPEENDQVLICLNKVLASKAAQVA